MSARVLVCLIVAAYLIVAKSANVSFYSDEYFSVVHVEEIVGDDGKVTFIGEALNIDGISSNPAHQRIYNAQTTRRSLGRCISGRS